VTPYDGIGVGTIGKATVVIRNSLPKISIESPTGGGKYYHNQEVNIHGKATDIDEDTLTVEWYIDLPDPENLTMTQSVPPDEMGGAEALKFEKKFSVGRHNLTLVVKDGEEGKASISMVSFKVSKGSDDEPDVEIGPVTTIAVSLIVIVIIIVVILILLLTLRKRKPKSEREKLYGKDMGLKPGEAYPVEGGDASTQSYFGDELDRKGVTSLEGPSTTPDQIPTTPQQAMPTPEKPPELPPTTSKQPTTPTTQEKPQTQPPKK
jgi:hypothetical protein